MLEIKNFTKIYKGENKAVDNLSLKVKKVIYTPLLVIMVQVKLQL